MKRVALGLTAVGLLTITDCGGSHETTEWCEDACRIWHDCTGWDSAECLSECRADGDWDETYLACLRAQSCGNLLACE
jgi:hypothetical protein